MPASIIHKRSVSRPSVIWCTSRSFSAAKSLPLRKRGSGQNPNSARESSTTPWCEPPRACAGCSSGRGASRSNQPDLQCGTPSTADIPDGTQAPAAVPRPPPSIAADPNPAAPRAATTPHRSSVDPSPQTPPGKSAGSVISNWHRGDILIGRLHDRLAPSNLGKSGFREPITPVTPDFDIREGRPAAARRAPVSRRALEVLSCGELGRGGVGQPPDSGGSPAPIPGGRHSDGDGCGLRATAQACECARDLDQKRLQLRSPVAVIAFAPCPNHPTAGGRAAAQGPAVPPAGAVHCDPFLRLSVPSARLAGPARPSAGRGGMGVSRTMPIAAPNRNGPTRATPRN
jgi:hypothetical protein